MQRGTVDAGEIGGAQEFESRWMLIRGNVGGMGSVFKIGSRLYSILFGRLRLKLVLLRRITMNKDSEMMQVIQPHSYQAKRPPTIITTTLASRGDNAIMPLRFLIIFISKPNG